MAASVVLINYVCEVLQVVWALPISEVAYVEIDGNIAFTVVISDSISSLVPAVSVTLAIAYLGSDFYKPWRLNM